jgi:hypothetical protein
LKANTLIRAGQAVHLAATRAISRNLFSASPKWMPHEHSNAEAIAQKPSDFRGICAAASQSGRTGFTKWTHRRQAMTGLRRYSSLVSDDDRPPPKRAANMCRPAQPHDACAAVRPRIAMVKPAIRRFTVHSDLVERSKP